MTGFLAITLGLVVLLLACLETGRRLRMRHSTDAASSGLSVIDGAIFGLLGLLLAFAFSGADNRFETRRQLIVQETNAIGTAWLRIDLLPAEAQPAIREHMRRYVDARIAFYRDLQQNEAASQADLATGNALQQQIWSESVAAAKLSPQAATLSLVSQSLNDMIDITTTRATALMTHPPAAIYILLLVLSLASALVAGYGMGDRQRRSWLHTLVYAAALTFTIYTIVDLEFPRAGLVRIDRYDQVLIQQRTSMDQHRSVN